MDPYEILKKHYTQNAKALNFLLDHSRRVADKALKTAERAGHLYPDTAFIEEAALLHDIGMIKTHAPMLSCKGEAPYIRHGVLGREMLEAEGLWRHALVCERHIGVGLSADDIRLKGLPLPERDMLPVSLEEQIICYADKFFSKAKEGHRNENELPLERVREIIAGYGSNKLRVFDGWLELYE